MRSNRLRRRRKRRPRLHAFRRRRLHVRRETGNGRDWSTKEPLVRSHPDRSLGDAFSIGESTPHDDGLARAGIPEHSQDKHNQNRYQDTTNVFHHCFPPNHRSSVTPKEQRKREQVVTPPMPPYPFGLQTILEWLH